MSEYLSKEEIKQWRSSLERITLEEFAARLGKKVEQAKPTNDIVDIVLQGKPVVSRETDWKSSQAERISTIAQRAFERERRIAPSPFSAQALKKTLEDENKVVKNNVKSKPENKVTTNKKVIDKKVVKEVQNTKPQPVKKESKNKTKKIDVVLNKPLTDREQRVFDYLIEKSNKIVYAKDLAELLDLPRDYVYKYIKNLRSKIEGEKLKNADKGGFILTV